MNNKLAAITSKYITPTNFYGSRVKVISQRGVRVYHVDYNLSFDQMHDLAVDNYLKWIKAEDNEKYGDDFGWGDIDDFIGGVTHTGEYIYVRKQKH